MTATIAKIFTCPKWLEKLILEHNGQIKETARYGASAHDIIKRLLKGSDDVDRMVTLQLESCDCKGDEYFRGLYNGLLMAQAQLQDSEFNPL